MITANGVEGSRTLGTGKVNAPDARARKLRHISYSYGRKSWEIYGS